MKRDDAQEAVDFFKRAVTGEPELMDLPTYGINYLPAVIWERDLPLRANAGDIIEVKSEGKNYVWNRYCWQPLDYQGRTMAPPATINPNHGAVLVKSTPTFDAGMCMVDNTGNLSLDTSLQKIIEKSQQEIEELRKEIHELKSRVSYVK